MCMQSGGDSAELAPAAPPPEGGSAPAPPDVAPPDDGGTFVPTAGRQTPTELKPPAPCTKGLPHAASKSAHPGIAHVPSVQGSSLVQLVVHTPHRHSRPLQS